MNGLDRSLVVHASIILSDAAILSQVALIWVGQGRMVVNTSLWVSKGWTVEAVCRSYRGIVKITGGRNLFVAAMSARHSFGKSFVADSKELAVRKNK